MRLLAVCTALAACTSAASAQQPVASHRTTAPGPRPVYVVARVNKAALLSDRLEAALQGLLPMESFHRNVSAQTVDQLRKRALEILVEEELHYQDGVSHGLAPTEKEVDAGLVRVVAGYKNLEAFEQARRQSGATTVEVRQEIHRALTIKKAYDMAVASRCEVTTSEAARFFADHPDRFIQPEQLHVYAITVGVDPGAPAQQWIAARARAEDVLHQIKGGAPFEEMARKFSTDKSRDRGGDMGLVHRGSLTDEFEQALRDMKPGQLSSVIQTLYGFHIVRVASILPSAGKTFSEVAAGLRTDLTRKQCAEMASAWTARLRAGATIVVADNKRASASSTDGASGARR